MKKILFTSAVAFTINIFAQQHTDARKAESAGYFIHPLSTTAGIVAADNFGSVIYLVQKQGVKRLVTSPGCGRYFMLSPDKSKIGFKQINEDGTQTPSLFDLETSSITALAKPASLCGQPSFSTNGKMVFTIGNELNIVDGNNTKTFNLGVYANITPVSPEGNYVIYNNDNDRLFMIDLITGVSKQITDSKRGYAFPQWSPDGNKVAYSTLSGTILVWNKATGKTYTIGEGQNVSWSDDSQYIIYNRTEVANFVYSGSDIIMASFDGTNMHNISSTTDVNEIAPSFGANNTILYSNFDKQEIVTATFDTQNSLLKDKRSITKYTPELSGNKNFRQSNANAVNSTQSIVTIAGTVPYVNQVYDAPTWDDGYCSCAPTSALMTMLYYNRLPKWPTSVNHGLSTDPHISNYGSYVADEYRYNTAFYDVSAVTCPSYNSAWGGHGYMWNGSNSPATMMSPYVQHHNVTSVYNDTMTYAGIKAEINNNYPYSMCNTLSSDGHVTVAIGYVNAQHTFIFNDPYGNKNTGTWPNPTGQSSYYDWPAYNNGYQNLNTIDWMVTSESTHLTYSDTLIDDVNYNNGFYIYNQGNALMRYYQDSETGGYGTFSHWWWTYSTSSATVDTCYVKWTPNLPTTGNYQVYAYVPSSGATATAAKYKVYYSGGNQTVAVNQATHAGQWVSLGTFPFLMNDTNGYVRLGDATGTGGQVLAFDAVKWSYRASTTGISKIVDADNLINIYPNPNNGNFVIESYSNEKQIMQLYDINGKLVLSQTINGNTSINANSLSEGIYNISIIGNQGVVNKRLVIVR